MFNRNSGSNEHDILQNQIRYNKLRKLKTS